MDTYTQELVDGYLDQRLTYEQLTELRDRLRADISLAKIFVQHCIDEARIADWAKGEAFEQGEVELNPRLSEERNSPREWSSNASTKPGRFATVTFALRRVGRGAVRLFSCPTPLSITVAAAVVGLLVVAMSFMAAPFYRQFAGRVGHAPPSVVAQLTHLHEAEWAVAQLGFREGTHLVAGRRLELTHGLAEITFKSGATVVLNAPATFTVESNNAGRLDIGQLAARVPKPARGFVVDTPTAQIEDLGTEFDIDVEKRGAVEVGVHAGVVQIRTHGAESVQRVVAGQVARTSGEGITVTNETPDNRIAHYIPGMQYGELVVQDDVENDGSWHLTGVGAEFDGSGYSQISRPAISGTVALALISEEDDSGSKTFSSVKLAPGVYNVIFWMGNYSSAQFPPGMSVEMSTVSHPITDLLVHSFKPTPPVGGWTRWTMTFEVPPGDRRIGETLQFRVQDGGGQGNGAFDSLRIWHAPTRMPSP